MRSFNRILSCILLIAMLFTMLPVNMLPEVAGDAVTTGNTGSTSGGGSINLLGGVRTSGNHEYYKPTFRVSIIRDSDAYNNGTPEAKSKMINKFKYKYPNIKMYEQSLIFEPWDVDMYNPKGTAYYDASSKELMWSTINEARDIIVKLKNQSSPAGLNKAKTALLNAGYGKVGADSKRISELKNGVWETYLNSISYDDAVKIWSYILKDNSLNYDVEGKMAEIISPYLVGVNDISTLEPYQVEDISVGYLGLLMSLYKIAVQQNANGYLGTIVGNYYSAVEDYCGLINIKEKPVAIVVDTAIAMNFSNLSDAGRVYLHIPSIDYLEYTSLTPMRASIQAPMADMYIRNPSTIAKYPNIVGNTKVQIEAGANEGLVDIPLYKTRNGPNDGGVRVRFSDYGPSQYGRTKFQESITKHPFVYGSFVPGWFKSNLTVAGNKGEIYKYSSGVDAEAGYMSMITFASGGGNDIKGFMISSLHVTDEVPDVNYKVSAELKKMQESPCDVTARPQTPNQITFVVKAESSQLSTLEARMANGEPNVSIDIKGNVYRETYLNNSKIVDKTEIVTLSNELTKARYGEELISFLTGVPQILNDTTILNDEFERNVGGGNVVTYKYYIENLVTTINGVNNEYTWDQICVKENGVYMNYAEHTMSAFRKGGEPVEDIVIPKPSSTTDLELDEPSINEVDSTLINRYDFSSGGYNYAEVKSNTPNDEKYEVMAGIPSTEEIYFSAGGTEFKLAIVLQYWMNEKGVDRTYRSVFSGDVACEYNKLNSDIWPGVTAPSPSGASSSDLTWNHDGDLVVSATWTGQITNSASPVTETKSTNHGTVTVNPKCPAQVVNTDYTNAVSQANAWMSTMSNFDPSFTAASDKVERKMDIPSMSIGSGGATTSQGASGSGGDSGSDGTWLSASASYSFSNPADTSASNSATANCTDTTDSEGNTTHTHGSATATATAQPDGPKPYTITVTYTIKPHAFCGPCCGHILPQVEDTWKQGIVYDYVKISQIRLYKIDQASVTGMTELIGTDEIFATIKSGDPTYFMNIAQLNAKDDPIRPDFPTITEIGNVGHRNTLYSGANRTEAQSSKYGRLRYSVEPEQHDTVLWEEGPRTPECDGMATNDNFGKSASVNIKPSLTTGHVNEWADGVLYTNPADSSDMNNTDAFEEDYNHHLDPDPAAEKTDYTDRSDEDDRKTLEWKKFDERRRTKNIATVISDFLILQTSGGDQSIFYFHKQTEPTETQEHFQKVKATEEEMFTANNNSIFSKAETDCVGGAAVPRSNLKVDLDFINMGGYNGRYKDVTKGSGADGKNEPYNIVSKSKLTVNNPSSNVDTFVDDDIAKTIKRPDRAGKFMMYEDHIQIKPTATNKVYTPNQPKVFYKQVVAYYSNDVDRLDSLGEGPVGPLFNLAVGLEANKYTSEYLVKWGDQIGLEYNTTYSDTVKDTINSVVVYTPVSTERATILPISGIDLNGDGDTDDEGEDRDQRADGVNVVNLNEQINKMKICPLDPGLCEFRHLNCKYLQDTKLAEFDFEPTYTVKERQTAGTEVDVIKQNTYQSGGKWVTTNKVTGIEYTLPTGFTIGTGKVGNGNHLNAFGTRWSIPFSDLGLSTDKSNRVSVKMDFFMDSNVSNKAMLVSFWEYDFWLQPNDGTTFGKFDTGASSTEDNTGTGTVKGNAWNRKVNIELTFGFNNVMDCEAKIDGVPVSVTVTSTKPVWETVGGIRKLVTKVTTSTNMDNAPENLTSKNIGNTLNIGSWGLNGSYPANYYIDNLEIWLEGGTHEHNSSCYTNVKVHETSKIHVHDEKCYAATDRYTTCTGVLNTNYQHKDDYPINYYVHSDSSPNNYYGNPSCGYTNGQAVCGIPETGSGVYNLVKSDDDSGDSLEAYISHSLTAGHSVKIQMGGYAGRSGAATLTVRGPNGFYHNSGQQSYSGYFEGSGSYKYEFVVPRTGTYTFETSNRTNDPYLGLYVREGHRHVSECYHYHTGSPGWSANGCYTVKNTHVHTGSPGTSPNGCYTKGEHRHTGTAGGTSPSGCYTKPTAHTHTAACGFVKGGELNCTGELNTLSDFNNHRHTPECLTTAVNLPTVEFNYTGEIQSYTVPADGYYTLKAWGASGGGDLSQQLSSHKGLGGYTEGRIYLTKGERIYVYVGGEGKASTALNTGGGWNGGGHGGPNGFGGGGATDFRLTRSGGSIEGSLVPGNIIEKASSSALGRFYDEATNDSNVSIITLDGLHTINIKPNSTHKASTLKNVFSAGRNYRVVFDAWSTVAGDRLYVDAHPDTLPEKSISLTTTKTEYTFDLTSNLPEMNNASLRFFSSASATSGNIYVTNIKVYDLTGNEPVSKDLISRIMVAGGGGGADNIHTGVLVGTADDGSGGHGGNLVGGSGTIAGVSSPLLDIEGLVLRKFDGSTWARVLYQDISNNTNYFTTANMLDSNVEGMFSALGKLPQLKSGSKYEFILEYPDATGVFKGAYNRWRQTKSPLDEKTHGGTGTTNVTGYEPIHIDMPSYGGNGLEYNGGSAILDGIVSHGNWWLAVGIMNNSYSPTNTPAKPYTMPGPNNGSTSQGVSQVALWVNVDGLVETGNKVSDTTNGGGTGQGGNQNTGYKFGIGESVTRATDTGGAGGGYWGGNVTNHNNGGAGGGSSYISGHPGVDSVNMYGNHIGQTNHYSGKVFTNTKMIQGVNNGNGKALIIPENTALEQSVDFNYTGDVQTYIVPHDGSYKLEAWGAQGGAAWGGGDSNGRGQGGYTSGIVELKKGTVLYIYVGREGEVATNANASKSFNGGGASRDAGLLNDSHQGGQGGGATDFRLQGGTWDSVSSLQRRILVAGGGGGTGCASVLNPRGDGGGLIGKSTYNNHPSYTGAMAYGGTQSAGGSGYYSNNNNRTGGFGFGANGSQCGAGGGGGYYGGGSVYTGGGGGGSSFVTGYPGADTTYRHLHNGLNFTNVSMVQGGNTGNGKARITPQNNILNSIVAGDLSSKEMKDYLGSEVYEKLWGPERVMYTWQNWTPTNMKGFVAMGSSTISASGNNLLMSYSGGSWEFKVPVDISDGSLIKEIKVTLDNNTTATEPGISKNGDGTGPSYFGSASGSVPVGAKNHVVTFKPNWSGKITSIDFDLMSMAAGSGTVLVKKIELIGYGHALDGTGEVIINSINKAVEKDTTTTVPKYMKVTKVTRYTNGVAGTPSTSEVEITAGEMGSTTTTDTIVSSKTLVVASGKTWNYGFTGGVQSFNIPATGNYKLEVWGAQGATGNGGGAGGYGGYATGSINLTAGQTINIYVGGQNGYNGGGSGGNSANSGGNGGGASDIRVGGTALGNRKIVAGGGGGSSGGSNGGAPNNRYSLVGAAGGTAHGGNGTEGNPSNASSTNPGAGKGATGSSGGAGGAGNTVNTTSSNDGAYYQSGGGGGGGGYYGGGGGASAAMNGRDANRSGTSGSSGTLGQGGSGGSGLTTSPRGYWSGTGGGGGGGSGYIGGVTSGTMSNGIQSGNGRAVITSLQDIWTGNDIYDRTEISYYQTTKTIPSTTTISQPEQKTIFEPLKITYAANINEFKTAGMHTFTAPKSGTYSFEAWGASGGGNDPNSTSIGSRGGKGGYTYGEIHLNAGETVYVYVGGQGGLAQNVSPAGWNGGGSAAYSGNPTGAGGGATDFRLISGTWDNITGLRSRIMVAGGGGGADDTGTASGTYNGANDESGGHAGGLVGFSAETMGIPSYSGFGIQTSGGVAKTNGFSGGFGFGGEHTGAGADYGGGGGGYYGGASGGGTHQGGGGGSSFISGFSGARAVNADGTHRADSTHYSGKVFTNMIMRAGNETMPKPTGGTEVGHVGNGYAKITYMVTKPEGSEIRQTILDNVDLIPSYLPNGEWNPIFLCRGIPFNEHICTENCKDYRILNCTEPHHFGEHYDGSNRICWEACGNDDKHKLVPDEVEIRPGEYVKNARFLQLDHDFTVYFPNIGNFAGDGALGLSKPQSQTGYGYHNNTDTTQWTREKRVKFPFNVIHKGEMYVAGYWIELEVTEEYFDFYLVLANSEANNAPVEFEVEAINAGTGNNQNLKYRAALGTVYANALTTFKNSLQPQFINFLRNGYKANDEAKGIQGYKGYFTWKQNEEKKLTAAKNTMASYIWSDFNGGTGKNNTNDGTPVANSINERAKAITANDNKNRPSNLLRSSSLESLHGGYKYFYLDVIGRIGNFVISDTEDFRFSNFFKYPKTDPPEWLVEGFIYEVEEGIQNYYLGDQYDLRGNKISEHTKWLNTYGTQDWLQGTFESGRNVKNPNIKAQVLSGDVNNIEQLKKEQLRFGYDIYTSVNTIGSYENGQVLVTPYYYALNLETGGVIPLDVHISKDGVYEPVNIFNNSTNGEYDKSVYKYNMNLDWTTESQRRNYLWSQQEYIETQRVAEFNRRDIYDYGPYSGDAIPPDDFVPTYVGTEQYRIPSGAYNYLGDAQSMLLNTTHRTFVGSDKTYGNEIENSNWGIDKNPGGKLPLVNYSSKAQRWHFKVGVPSSSVFVRHGYEPNEENIQEIMDNKKYAILSTVSIVSIGSVWDLEYQQPWVSTVMVNGKPYDISGKNIPPIVAVFSSDKSSVQDVDIIKTH